ncbi:MAG: hypothetical protein HFH89_09910 [Lachnospiraceae bacterium]|nr:hypothetical protein [uncultured Acetatifactor sp.]MCI8287950.1 hypothetical protein [Lachnospiraceae bacterium]
MESSSRTRNSFLNALSAILLTLINGLLGIIVTRLVINKFGSDFNGLNSTVNQIVNVLLILEGGFTLASNVALFEPISKKDYSTSNGVLRATRFKFRKIAVIFLIAGLLVAGVYSSSVRTNLAREFVFTMIMMAVVPQALNLFYTTTYRVLLQTQQKEYIINVLTTLTIGSGHIMNIVLISYDCKMWMVRFTTMCFAFLNSIIISEYTKRKNIFIDFSEKSRLDLIKGTNDVMAQKITGVIYTSWPIVFLSISSSAGTLLASVYAVYNNVFVMIKALLHGVIDAPRLGFGQILTERKKEEVWGAFKEYEYIAIFFTFIMMTVSCGLILPFINLYTRNVDDINYYDKIIAILMVLIGTTEMLHIPSGHMINMSGNFKVSKNFQIMACILLIMLMTLLGSISGVYGMLISLLLVAILLAVLEIGYIHTKFFESKTREFILLSLPYILIGILLSYLEIKGAAQCDSIITFIVLGFAFTIMNSAIAIGLGFAFNKTEIKTLLLRCNTILGHLRH